MKLFSKRTRRPLAAAVFATLGATAMAQQADLVPPVPDEVPGLDAAGMGTEGLHVVRFTVRADGSTDDVEVAGGFTNAQAKTFLTQMVRGWTFTPGTVNGEPADFFNQEYVVRHYLAEELILSEEVNDRLAEINELVAQGEHDKAVRETRRLIEREAVTALDYTVAHEILTGIYMTMDMPFEALEASQVATMSRTNLIGEKEYLLPDQMLDLALRKRLMLALAVQQTAEADRVIGILEQDLHLSADDPVREVGSELRSALASPEPLVSQARIVDKQWSYKPARRIFTVANIEGSLKDIEVRCQRGNIELEYEADVDWTIPDSLGDCTLDIAGKKGTRFALYEFAE